MVDIVRLMELPLGAVWTLQVASRAEGLTFVDRLVDEYVAGTNRFELPGEALFGAYADKTLIGIGGLNRDPYLQKAGVGRVRHLYVLAAWRRQRVGAQLMQRIIDEAHEHFDLLTLRTFSDEADRFYRRIGFKTEPVIDGATHHLCLRD